MFTQFPGYYEFRGFDLSGEADIAIISNKLYGNCHKPSWGDFAKPFNEIVSSRRLCMGIREIPEESLER